MDSGLDLSFPPVSKDSATFCAAQSHSQTCFSSVQNGLERFWLDPWRFVACLAGMSVAGPRSTEVREGPKEGEEIVEEPCVLGWRLGAILLQFRTSREAPSEPT